jgi:hypothetical protein
MGDPAQEPRVEAAGSVEGADLMSAFIIQRIEHLETELATFRDSAERHWSEEARRFALIDQFLNPAMQIDGLIRQLSSLGQTQNQMIVQMQTTIERELGAMRSALRLAVSTGGLELQPQAQKN